MWMLLGGHRQLGAGWILLAAAGKTRPFSHHLFPIRLSLLLVYDLNSSHFPSKFYQEAGKQLWPVLWHPGWGRQAGHHSTLNPASHGRVFLSLLEKGPVWGQWAPESGPPITSEGKEAVDCFCATWPSPPLPPPSPKTNFKEICSP